MVTLYNATYNSRQAIYVQLRIVQCHVEFDNLIGRTVTYVHFTRAQERRVVV